MCIRQSLCTACLILLCISVRADEPSSLREVMTPPDPAAHVPAPPQFESVAVEPLQAEKPQGIPAEIVGQDQCCSQSATGCACRNRWVHKLRDSHWGFRVYFSERPFGSLVHAHMQAHAWNGLRDQLVLYEYDFVNEQGRGGANLNVRGWRQLTRFAEVQRQTSLPLVIEQTTVNPGLDNARRQSVLAALGQMGVPAIPQLVVVGKPNAFGSFGTEGPLIYSNQLLQTRERGAQRIGNSSLSRGGR